MTSPLPAVTLGADMPPRRRWRNQSISLKVEDVIFTIDRHVLLQASPVFKDMFVVGDSSSGEGTSEDNPIMLEGYKADDFEALLKVLYPTTEDLISGKFALTKEEWIGVSKLARAWEMQKIREFAFRTLSDKSMKLSNVEKVNLGREHGVASWLIEGVAGLVERDPAMSADDLETALGLRTAFKIVSLQARFENNSPISTILLNGTIRPSVPLSAIRCQTCLGRLIAPASFACHSCSRSIGTNDRRTIYLNVYSTLWPEDQGRPGFAVKIEQVYCVSCMKPAFVTPVACPNPSCGVAHSTGYGIFTMRGSWPDIYSPSSGIKAVFKDDLAGCDM